MNCVSTLVTGAAVAALALPVSSLAAEISGTVKYDGKVPKLRPVKMDADPSCAEKHSKPVPSDLLVLGPNKEMANIIVKVKGADASGAPARTDEVVLDQSGCIYIPHVLAVQQGQPVKILNSDGILHNVHALPKANSEFNTAMPASRKEVMEKFDKAEKPFVVKCDVHPWMKSYVEVLDHPFFDTTGEDGKYTISNLPAGSYEIEAWHEKLGTTTQKVTVAADEKKTLDITISRKKK